MRFKFCGDLDCPDWVLSEIATLSKLSSVRIKVLVVQIIEYCLQGTFNYEKVLKLAGNNADGLSDTKVRGLFIFNLYITYFHLLRIVLIITIVHM